MAAYLAAALGPSCPQSRLTAYCERSVDHFEWLTERGVAFKESFYPDPVWVPPTDDGLIWLGENSWPFCELAPPAPRGHRPMARGRGGWVLMEHLGGGARNSCSVLGDTRVDRLVLSEDGEIVGLLATSFGARVRVRVRRGVVLAGGGFIYNDRMLRQHAPQLEGLGKVGSESDDGLCILLGQAAGAATEQMDAGVVAWAFGLPPAILSRSLLIDEFGQRITNEDGYPGRTSHQVLSRRGGSAFLVLDGAAFDELSDIDRAWQPTWVADSVAELEQQMGLPERTLQATVENFNHFAKGSSDPVFHKDARWLRALRPPYGAIDPRIGPSGRSAGNGVGSTVGTSFDALTLGGLAVNDRAEVLDLTGEVIPRLFAAGRTTAGLAREGYVSGVSLGDSTFFGRIAGASAVGTVHAS